MVNFLLFMREVPAEMVGGHLWSQSVTPHIQDETWRRHTQWLPQRWPRDNRAGILAAETGARLEGVTSAIQRTCKPALVRFRGVRRSPSSILSVAACQKRNSVALFQFCALGVGLGAGLAIVSGAALEEGTAGGGAGTSGAKTTGKLAAGLFGCVEAVGGLAGDGAATAAASAMPSGDLDVVVEFEAGVEVARSVGVFVAREPGSVGG